MKKDKFTARVVVACTPEQRREFDKAMVYLERIGLLPHGRQKFLREAIADKLESIGNYIVFAKRMKKVK